MKRILFVCKKNSRRSQMAEGFAKQMAGDRAIVASAGLAGSEVDRVSNEASEAASRIGLRMGVPVWFRTAD